MVSRGGNGEDMTKNEGSFWRDMRYIGVPGVDNLNQIGPGIVADFPKLAGSAAHLFGRPQAWTEAGGGVGQNGKFVFDYQLVRGINYMNIRGLNSAPPPPEPRRSGVRHRLVRQPRPTPDGHRPARGPGRTLSPDRQLLAGRPGGPGSRHRHRQTDHAVDGAADRLRPYRQRHAGHGLHAGKGRAEELERPVLPCRDRSDFDRDPEERAGTAARLCRRRRQGRVCRPHADRWWSTRASCIPNPARRT